MSVHKYLDETGLALVWSKIRSALNLKANRSELSLVATSGTMSSLDDTNVSSPSDGQVLTYNSTNSKWINSDLPNDVMIVSYNGNSADKTFLEIYSHINNGGTAILIYLDCIYHLYSFSQYGIEFRLINTVDDSSEGIYATSSFCVHISNQNEVTYDEIWISSPKESISTPLMNGTASVGVSYRYAHGDHVHPTDTTRAAVADVLTKTNTTSYTPTGDYHPATKKYVDDKSDDTFIINLSSSGSGSSITYSFDKTYSEIENAYNAGKQCIVIETSGNSKKYYYYLSEYDSNSGFYFSCVNLYTAFMFNVYTLFFSNNNNTIYKNSHTVYNSEHIRQNIAGSSIISNKNTNTSDGSWNTSTATKAYSKDDIFLINYNRLVKATTDIASGATLTQNTNYVETTIADELELKANVANVLTKTNTTSYTPTSDYHPATKKYVDDATSGITSDLSGLTDTTISSPADGQLLKYNATTSKWENVTLSLAINNNVIQLKEGNTVISSVTLPIYNGGVSS